MAAVGLPVGRHKNTDSVIEGVSKTVSEKVEVVDSHTMGYQKFGRQLEVHDTLNKALEEEVCAFFPGKKIIIISEQ